MPPCGGRIEEVIVFLLPTEYHGKRISFRGFFIEVTGTFKGQSWRCEAQTYHSPGANKVHAASFLLSLSVFIYQMGIMNLCLLGGFSVINLCECWSYNFT